MARYFLDTSVIIKLYRPEPDSPVIRAIVGPADDLLIAQTTPLEIRSSTGLLARAGVITPVTAASLVEAFTADKSNFELAPLDSAVLAIARRLLDSHTIADGLRMPDSLQLASAISENAYKSLDALVTTDKTLARLAAAHGLTVLP
jgi:predicted nucleic acid-binding protein